MAERATSAPPIMRLPERTISSVDVRTTSDKVKGLEVPTLPPEKKRPEWLKGRIHESKPIPIKQEKE